MKKFTKIATKRAISALLCAVMIFGALSALSACEKKKSSPVLMEYEGAELTLSVYEFLLSRMKGSLYSSREDVKDADYWRGEYSDGVSREEYYNGSILENAKVYLVALAMFEELCESGEIDGLPSSYLEAIEEDIALYVDLDYVGGGSEEKFSELLSDYGIDLETYREILIMEAKISYLQSYLYGGDGASKIGDNVKEEFLRENYYYLKHILVGNFYYKYECDTFGNKIYYDGPDGDVLYDYENGVYKYDANGNHIADGDGTKIAFDPESGEYLYDEKNGETRFVCDSNGDPVKYKYTEAQMSERKVIAEELANIASGDFEAFEAKGTDANVNTDYSGAFSRGVYLSQIESKGYDGYMLEMLGKLKDMKAGDVETVEADDGYHVFMKYEPAEGAYADESNSKWFGGFNGSLITEMFLNKCRAEFGDIKIDEGVLDSAVSIKDIGINTDY